MEIDISKIPEYFDYMTQRRAGKFDESERLLNVCIDMAKRADDKFTLTFLINRMGDIYSEKGDPETALNYYLEAEKVDERFFGSIYQTAVFMVDRLRDYRRAIEKCDEVIRAAEEPQSDADACKYGDIRYTAAQCHALQGYCYVQLEDIEKAGVSLSHLQELLGYNYMQYDFKICEALIKKGTFVKEAKEHLRRLKAFLDESEDYHPLVEEIVKLLNLAR